MSDDFTKNLTDNALTEILARLDVMGKHLLSLESKVDALSLRLNDVEERLAELLKRELD